MCWITHVRSCLIANTDREESGEPSVDQQGEERVENAGDKHDPFDYKYEDGNNGYDKVELGGAGHMSACSLRSGLACNER